jgi:hypothetical protein
MRAEATIHAAAGVHRSLETQRAEYPLCCLAKLMAVLLLHVCFVVVRQRLVTRVTEQVF